MKMKVSTWSPDRIPTRCHVNWLLAGCFLGIGSFATAQEPGSAAVTLANAITKKFAAARQYAFDGVIELARRRRDEGWEVVLSSKVKLAVAPEGKYLLWAGDKDNLQYLVVSDGQNTWTYQPASNRYMQRAAGAAGGTVALD